MRKLLVAAVLFAWLFALCYSHANYSMPITSDAFERIRVASLVASNQPLSTPYSPQTPYNYPLLFDYVLATVATVFQLDLFFGLVVLSVLFSAVLLGLVYSFARKFGDEQAGLFALPLVLFAPLLFFRLVTPISETLGLVLFFAAILSYFRGNYSASFAFLVLLLFSHYRSFAVATAVIALYSALNHKQLLRPLAATISLPCLAYFLLIPKDFSIQNPWVVQAGAFDYFLPILLGLFLMGFAITLFKTGISRHDFSFLASAAAAPLLLGFLAPFPFRQLAYFFPVAILFAAVFLSSFYSSLSTGLKPAFVALFFAFALLSLNGAIQNRAPPISSDKAAALQSLSCLPGTTVLAPFYESYAIPLYAEKKVVAGAFLEGLPDGAVRAKDSYDFFHGATPAQRHSILDKYSVDLVCLQPGQYPLSDSWLLPQSRLQKKYSSPFLECWG